MGKNSQDLYVLQIWTKFHHMVGSYRGFKNTFEMTHVIQIFTVYFRSLSNHAGR